MNKFLIPALLGCLVTTPALAATVVNGSFESPSVGSVTYGNAGTAGGAGYEPNGGQFGYAPAFDGVQILHLQGTGTGTLNLTDLVIGQDYTTTFFAAARPGYLTLPVSISYNSTVIGTFTPVSTAFTAFTGFNFTATGTVGTLTFTGLNPLASASNDRNAGVDLVSVSAIPEPASWALMLVGFGMVGAGVRSRRKVSVNAAFN